MLRHLTNQFEKVIIISMIVTLMLVSVISWGKIITGDSHKSSTPTIVEKPKATSQIQNGIILFAGLAIVASEFLQLSDEE